MTDQLAMFEPTGPEVLALAAKHERDASRAFSLAQSLDVTGWTAAAHTAYKQFHLSERLSAELYMLAEFEALGGVS